MARRILKETTYTFTPSTKTIVIPKFIPRERLVLITNVTQGVPIFNFSDSRLTATSYTTSAAADTTTIVLSYNTTAMSSGDKLQVMVDDVEELFNPSETLMDPVGKLRVSTPQSLIDTDFEYGLQPTKWESLTLVNNRPTYYSQQLPLTITGVNVTSGSRTVTVATSSPPAVGTPVLVQDTLYGPANGDYVVETVSAGTNFTYTMRRAATSTASIYNSALTLVYTGALFTGANVAIASITSSGNTVTVTTTQPHGIQLGNKVHITGTTAATSGPPNGTWQVQTTPSQNTFTVQVVTAPVGAISGGVLVPTSESLFVHRPSDGGVQYSPGTPFHGIQTFRQTRRNFRYQSGKGIQMSTAVVFKPQLNVDAITNSGTTVTVTTKTAHNLFSGATITVAGATPTAYNGTFSIFQVLNETQFTYIAGSTPGALTSGIPTISVNSWYDSDIKVGMFDNQNGAFFKFDGQTLKVVRRSSVTQLAGTVNVTNGSCTVTGVSSLFSKQLVPGEFIVIRGMTYRVHTIASDTSMTVFPEYRGPTLSGLNTAYYTKVIDTEIAQSAWNIDRCDGTGPSGYSLDLTKVQMLYMDYSWYGGGAIRFGFKNTRGEVIYCHRIVNNNLNTEAYFRSGNLPARYEVSTLGLQTYMTATANATTTTLSVANTSGWPSTGTIFIANPAANSYEYANYTGLTSTSLTGLTRGKATSTVASCNTFISNNIMTTTSAVTGIQIGQFVYGTNIPEGTYITNIQSGATSNIVLSAAATATATGVTLTALAMGSPANTHTYSATAPIGVYLHAPQYAPTLSHWGSSVIMDGRFDDDKSFLFTGGMTTELAVNNGATNALLSLRLAPAADSGIGGLIGLKDVINRMQLTLRSIGMLSNGRFLVSLVLNGTVSGGTYTAVGGSSLAQVCYHTSGTTITGGEVIYSFYTNTAGGTNYTVTTADLEKVRDLGNSVLGGGDSLNVNAGIYPNGPDVLTVVVRNITGATANTSCRISWSEAQA